MNRAQRRKISKRITIDEAISRTKKNMELSKNYEANKVFTQTMAKNVNIIIEASKQKPKE